MMKFVRALGYETSMIITYFWHLISDIIFICINAKAISTSFLKLLYVFFFRLQTGMRGAFGKPQGTVARVNIGQPIMSVRSSDRYKAQVIEALRRAKFKFPGRQKVNIFIIFIKFCI